MEKLRVHYPEWGKNYHKFWLWTMQFSLVLFLRHNSWFYWFIVLSVKNKGDPGNWKENTYNRKSCLKFAWIAIIKRVRIFSVCKFKNCFIRKSPFHWHEIEEYSVTLFSCLSQYGFLPQTSRQALPTNCTYPRTQRG